MRSLLVIALAFRVFGQDTGTRVVIPQSDLSRYRGGCLVKDEADVQAEIKRQTDRAKLVENVLSFGLLVITGDEGGKAEQEGIPALLKKAETGAKLTGYWDTLMAWSTGRSSSRAFYVCEPVPGTGIIVVAPLKGALAFTAASGLAGAVPQNLRPLSWDDLTKQTTLATQCWSSSSVRAFGMAPYVTGRIVETTILGKLSTVPVASQWVSVAGPGYRYGCSTTSGGDFSFTRLPPGNYTLYIGAVRADTFVIGANTNLNLGDLGVPFNQ